MANDAVNTAQPTSQPAKSNFKLSLDVWAVTVAFVLAALVRTGVLKHITW